MVRLGLRDRPECYPYFVGIYTCITKNHKLLKPCTSPNLCNSNLHKAVTFVHQSVWTVAKSQSLNTGLSCVYFDFAFLVLWPPSQLRPSGDPLSNSTKKTTLERNFSHGSTSSLSEEPVVERMEHLRFCDDMFDISESQTFFFLLFLILDGNGFCLLFLWLP